MTARRVLLWRAATSFTILCGGQELVAQAARPSLESLAAAWSAGHSAPTCIPSPNRHPAVQALGTEECSWPRIPYAGGSAQVTGTRYRQAGLASISWVLHVRSRAAAVALRDSLSQAFRQLGLKEYQCRSEGRHWQRPGIGVDFRIGAVFPDGLLGVGVVATPLTDALPAFMCPAAPALPGRRPAASLRRSTAT